MQRIRWKEITSRIQLFLFLVTISVMGYSQNVDEDLKKISLNYQDDINIMISKKINYYESYTAKQPTETNNTILKRDGDQLYTKAFDTETIIVKDISMLIDHKSKVIILDRNNGKEFKIELTPDFGAIKKMCSNIKYKDEGENACYTFHYETGNQVKSEVWFNKENHEVKKIVFYMRGIPTNKNEEKNNPSRLEILITEFKNNCDFDSTTFDIKQYIASTNNEIMPTTKYKGYQLINNIRN
jgi:hypothetical protein